MHLPRPRLRLRLRTLLIAVAVAGAALGGWTMWKRRAFCLTAATKLARIADFYESVSRRLAVSEGASRGGEEAVRCRRMAARYRHVARYPWLPLPREPE